MARTLTEISADLNVFTHDHFQIAYYDSLASLSRLCEEMFALDTPTVCVPVLFRFLERMDGADIGLPGPVVHTLERWEGHYEGFLIDSVRRKPAEWTILMINRIINAQPTDTEFWLQLLQETTFHPSISEIAKTCAILFLDHQKKQASIDT